MYKDTDMDVDWYARACIMSKEDDVSGREVIGEGCSRPQ